MFMPICGSTSPHHLGILRTHLKTETSLRDGWPLPTSPPHRISPENVSVRNTRGADPACGLSSAWTGRVTESGNGLGNKRVTKGAVFRRGNLWCSKALSSQKPQKSWCSKVRSSYPKRNQQDSTPVGVANFLHFSEGLVKKVVPHGTRSEWELFFNWLKMSDVPAFVIKEMWVSQSVNRPKRPIVGGDSFLS